MNDWQHRLLAGALLAGFTVWAGAAETARTDTDVPAPLIEAAAAPADEAELMPAVDVGGAPQPAAVPRGPADRLELDPTAIRGNQELPKVLYIVPWKDPALGDLVGKPVNSLVDEVLAPVDRDVFRRQIRYFDQLYGEAGNPSAGP
ncbi:MAG: hypothetical protein JSV45_11875 [Chromatiales bacterium]|nr:MAG: hypothetical protein JSV45_11875 [Chromatiales bacterium]